MQWELSSFLPAWNASLNALAAILLLIGYRQIRTGQRDKHLRTMKAAFRVSAVFLASYLYYHYAFPHRLFGGTGAIRTIYFTMLVSHIILAVANLPFIFRILYLAKQEDFARHAKLARIVWPVWMYTSVTGVLVYFFLYQWFPTPIPGLEGR